MTVDPSESNKINSEDSTLEESMCLFLVWPLGGLFLALQLVLIDFGLSLLVLHFCLAKSVVGNLRHLSLTLSILEILCKSIPLKIMIIYEAKKI